MFASELWEQELHTLVSQAVGVIDTWILPIAYLEAIVHRAAWTFLLVLLSACATVSAQTSATSTVPIALRIPGSISLSLRSTPVTVSVENGVQQQFEVPLTVQWNLDPRDVPGFGVVAYFRDPQAALVDSDTDTSVPAGYVMARWGSGQFHPFQASDASLTVFHTTVLPELRHGNESQNLELKIADNATASLPNGEYQGVLYLEVRNY